VTDLFKLSTDFNSCNCGMNMVLILYRDSKEGIETLLKTQTSSSAAKQINVLKNVAEITTIYRRWCLTFSGIGLKFQV
jgi:hypothetical protein